MRIQILGTAAAEGWPAIFCNCSACARARELGGKNIRTRAATLVDGQLLIDYSADTYQNALRFGLDLSLVHTLLVTHDHEDHLYSDDLGCRYTWFAHLGELAPPQMMVYGNDRVGLRVRQSTSPYGGLDSRIGFTRTQLFRPIALPGGYIATPLAALHDRSQECCLYLLEDRSGKRMLYGHDTGRFPPETLDALRGKRLDFVMLDCTNGPQAEGTNHMGLPDNSAMRDKLQELGCVSEQTQLVVTHFSHNGGLLHEELEAAARPLGFSVAYDGVIYQI